MSNLIPVTVSDLTAPQLQVYTSFSETGLLRYYEPEPGLFVAESPNVILRALSAGYEPVSFLMQPEQLKGDAEEIAERAKDVPVYLAPEETLRQLTGYAMTRGVLGAFRRKKLPQPEEILAGARRIAILEDVMNPTNLGAIFRSAAALGIDAVLLTGGCTDPLYRRSARVSLGTVFQVPWTDLAGEAWNRPERAADTLHEMGFSLAAMALQDRSVPIDDPAVCGQPKLAILLGSEGPGLREETLAVCDHIVRIPMSHGVDSLNVAAASAVAFWQLCRAGQFNP